MCWLDFFLNLKKVRVIWEQTPSCENVSTILEN